MSVHWSNDSKDLYLLDSMLTLNSTSSNITVEQSTLSMNMTRLSGDLYITIYMALEG